MDFLKYRWGLVAIVTMALLVGGWWPAAAADTPTVQPVLAAVVTPPPYNWSGLYVGLFAGGAFGGNATAKELGSGGVGYNGLGHQWSNDLKESFIGGGQIGYNFQISPLVLGIENEAGYIGLKATKKDPLGPGGDTSSTTKVGNWFDILAVRLGVAVDRALFYTKGGVAFTDVSSKVIDNCTTGTCGAGTVKASGSKTVTTWAVGGGLEYAVANNWTVKGEYLFIDLDKAYRVSGPGGGTAAGATWSWRHRVEAAHTIKVGINYKF